MSTLREFAGALCDLRRAPVGDAIRRKLAIHALDAVGSSIVGATTEEWRHLAALSEGTHPVFGETLANASALGAARIRLTEIDDIHLASCITPSSVVVATMLTTAARLRVDSGERLLAALAVGYEAMIRLGLACDGPVIVHRGVWPTYLAAPIGAAAVTAALLDLDEDRFAAALGLALLRSTGQLGAGTSRWLPLAMAVGSGVSAALAAAAGHGADLTLFDQDWWPRSRAVAVDKAALLSPPFGAVVAELSMKRYCAAKQTIAAIDAFRTILDEGTAVDAITGITVGVPAAYSKMIGHKSVADRTGRITSVAYHLGLAAALPDQLDNVVRPDLSADRAVTRIMSLVTVEDDPALDPHYPGLWPARVVVRTASGKRERAVLSATGDPATPLSPEEMTHKFRRLAEPVIGAARCDEVAAASEALVGGGRVDLRALAAAG